MPFISKARPNKFKNRFGVEGLAQEHLQRIATLSSIVPSLPRLLFIIPSVRRHHGSCEVALRRGDLPSSRSNCQKHSEIPSLGLHKGD